MVQVTGSFGTWVADRLRLQCEDVRSLSVASMAAGFTALFGAPLGRAFLALKILHHQYFAEYIVSRLKVTDVRFGSSVGVVADYFSLLGVGFVCIDLSDFELFHVGQ